MAMPETVTKIKNCLRITHTALDDEINDWIESGLSDLRGCGILYNDETDPAILAALKTYCKAQLVEDMDVADKYKARYDEQKASLMMREGYGAI